MIYDIKDIFDIKKLFYYIKKKIFDKIDMINIK